jgi:zeaxanthin glucosyltransferase
MSTIAICIFPFPSTILSAVGLAKRLRRRGHRVCIISTPDVESPARAADIEFVPVLAGLYHAGNWVEQTRFYATLSRLALVRELRRALRLHRAIMDGMLASEQNEIDQSFERIAPDLVLIYSDMPVLAVAGLMALRRGIRCAYVTPVYYHYLGPASPPLSSGLVPRPGVWSRWLVRLAWARFFLASCVLVCLNIALGLDLDLPHILHTLSRQAGGAGWPLEWNCFLAPMLRLPEFFLTPRELDFPIEPRDGSHWLGWADDDRVEEPFPWERVDPLRQLVYCTLGTMLYLPLDRQRAFLQAVIDALAARPHLQLALATGGFLSPTDLVVRAPDAIVLERMPQLQVLSRARLMITHCGVKSFQECARQGVPMIAFPLGYDQFGNAARVIYHGLGLRGDIRRATADEIGYLIDAVVEDEAMRQRCAAMAALSRDNDRYEAGMRTLEALAKRP